MPESSPKYDLILRGGWVIDPANGRDGPMDVAISGGKITAVDRQIGGATAKKELDVAGLYVTPGLIDLHAHFYGGGGGYKNFEMNPDMYGLPNGTTTVVDAGGAGWLNYGGFIDRVVHGFKVRVLGLLNICAQGMHTHHENDPKSLMPDECARTIRENRGVFVGIKTAHYMQPGYESVNAAVKAGEIAGVPVMMDSWPTDVRNYPDMILKHLRPGDIHTHFYAQHFPWLERAAAGSPTPTLPLDRGRGSGALPLDEGRGVRARTPDKGSEDTALPLPGGGSGSSLPLAGRAPGSSLPLAGGGSGWGWKVAPYMWEARKRGVIFDVGHGGGSFWFRIAGPAMAQGFGPDTISTDAHSGSFYLPRATMPVTISKLLCLGMPLQEAVDRSTRVPAKVIGRADLGTLSVGAEADVAVFELERAAAAQSGFGYVDSGGARMKGDKRLTCAMTIRAGQVLYDRDGLSRPDYRVLGDYKRVE